MVKIKRIALKNVKSYVDETIEFYDGVNFICGPNGSGKTTIVESIGYALFGWKPNYRFDEFIRHGEKRGSIEITIEANDEREYRIVRQFTTRGAYAWMVFDEETGAEIESSDVDVKDWLVESLGLSRGSDPDHLFGSVIGVRQGEFVTPFLDTPKRRENYFNSILNLESYRNAFQKTAGIESRIRSEIELLDERIRMIAERTADYDEKLGELEAIKKAIGDAETERERLEKLLAEKEKILNMQRQLREEIIVREQERARHDKRLERAKAELEGIRSKVQECRDSLEIVRATSEAHERYLRIEEELKKLESNRRRRDDLIRQRQEVERELSSHKGRLVELRRNYRERSEEIDAETVAVNEALQAGQAEIDVERARLAEIDRRLDIVKQIDSNRDELRRYQRKIERSSDVCEQIIGRIEELAAEREALERSIQEVPGLRASIAEKELIVREIDSLKSEAATLKERIRAANRNAKAAKGGKCPLLSIDCPAIEGDDLETYFKREAEEIGGRLSAIEDEIRRKSDLVADIDADRRRLAQLEAGMTRVKEISDLIDQNRNRLCETINKVNLAPIESIICEVRDRLASFGVSVETKELATSGKSLSGLSPALEEVIMHLSRETQQVQDDILKEREDITGKISALSAELSAAKRRQKQLDKQRKDLSKLQEEIESLSVQIKQLEISMSDISKKIQLSDGIDEKIAMNNAEMDEIREDHEQYMRHESTASRLEEYEAALDEKKSEIDEIEQDLKLISQRIEKLQSQYDPKVLTELETEVNSIVGRLAGIRERLNGLFKDKKRIESEILEMKRLIEEGKRYEKEREQTGRALELLSFLRSRVLNQAGDRIAARYRETVSREASQLYREVSGEPVQLNWGNSYEINLVTRGANGDQMRSLNQLSGGEQMTAALAVRLALLRSLSGAGLGIFDEPTANLDEDRRMNLAKAIPHAVRGFTQLFIISHDDSFDSITENVVRLEKNEDAGSRLADRT